MNTLWDYAQSIGSAHAPLTRRDLTELHDAARRVFELMRDGRWHTRDEIELAAGQDGVPAREGLRRMRELRQAGWDVQKARMDAGRCWQYRLVR